MGEMQPNSAPTPRDESVTHWIMEVKAGNSDAAQELWNRYFDRLVRLAQLRLKSLRTLAIDAEDVALSAFDSFCRAAQDGRFPNLADRDSLWRLIVQITVRKAISQRRHALRQRRGGGNVIVETDLAHDHADAPQLLAAVIGDEPGPEVVALMSEEVERLLNLLKDETLRDLAIGKMEGYSNEELAQRLGCSLRTVERRLHLIREMYRRDEHDDDV